MYGDPLTRFRSLKFALALALLAAIATAAAFAGRPVTSTASAQSSDPLPPECQRAIEFSASDFQRQPNIDNRWLPFTPGTQYVLQGIANRGGGLLPHTVTFTVTDLTKVIAGVRTVVVWDVDVNEGELSEAELAFFAQDEEGNVWNLGEYPEEFDGGDFLGAPNTWIAGIDGAEAGLHMRDFPLINQRWLQGFAPTIDFLDCAHVADTWVRDRTPCPPIGCFSRLLLTRETSPLDPAGGVQLKYHAEGVGIVEIGAENDPEGETLVMSSRRMLSPEELAAARNEACRLDSRGYVVSPGVYGQTAPVEPPPGVACQSPQSSSGRPGSSSGPGTVSAGGRPAPKPARKKINPANYTHKVNHPLVPLTKVRRTDFRGHEEDTATRVVTKVLKRTRRVAGVRVAIVAVREFEDGELVERTEDYYAQDRKGRVWYFGEKVDDIENGKVVDHGGQWLAGANGAEPGLFMPAKPKVGKVFEQERAPGVAEDRSKVVAVGRKVTTPAGSFTRCIKTRDFAPLDQRTEFKFYCAGVGLVREQAPQTRLALVRYR
jgi:hypothetical protein